jgi:hypothetical protein
MVVRNTARNFEIFLVQQPGNEDIENLRRFVQDNLSINQLLLTGIYGFLITISRNNFDHIFKDSYCLGELTLTTNYLCALNIRNLEDFSVYK